MPANRRSQLHLDPLSRPLQNLLGWLYYYARRYEEGLDVCGRILEFEPHHLHTLGVQGLIYTALHRYDDAIRVLNLCGGVAYSAYACGLGGRSADAKELLETMERRAESAWVAPSGLAAACVGIGEYDRALHYLERACDVRDPIMTVFAVLPIFNPLRGDPRYGRVLGKSGSRSRSILHGSP